MTPIRCFTSPSISYIKFSHSFCIIPGTLMNISVAVFLLKSVIVSSGFISKDTCNDFHLQELMVSFLFMDWALFTLRCSAQECRGTAAVVTRDTASQTAIKRKHRMLFSLKPEHTEPISSSPLCSPRNLNTKVMKKSSLTSLSMCLHKVV